MSVRILLGDCRERLRGLPDGMAQTCVTSPPYFGLRDYGVDGQIGLEATPDEFVAAMVEVFREVRRVLREDGTLWLNLGDSYAGAGYSNHANTGGAQVEQGGKQRHLTGTGCKPKDLIGIPWMLARALRDPYYTGPVKDVCDQVWLAAMLDAEGSICGTEYQSGDRIKTNIYISITNTSAPVIEKCDRLFPQEVGHVYEKVNGTSKRKCFRWDVERMDQKALFLRTIYPHLVAKRKQAIIAYTFIEMQRGLVSKKKGYLAEQHEQRSWLMQALSLLNSGQDVDIPDWCIEPPSLFEPGYYLRQDIIWAKPNPMPESVRDRCTKAHEYVFLLSKGPRYYFDANAIAEGLAPASVARLAQDVEAQAGSQRVPGKTNGAMKAVGGKGNRKTFRGGGAYTQGQSFDNSARVENDSVGNAPNETGKRNKRSVWTVATQPFKEAHFATYPPELIEPCILAGAPRGGLVLDPFGGAGTTGLVADRLGRDALLIELNPEYAEIARKRLTGDAGMFAQVEVAA